MPYGDQIVFRMLLFKGPVQRARCVCVDTTSSPDCEPPQTGRVAVYKLIRSSRSICRLDRNRNGRSRAGNIAQQPGCSAKWRQVSDLRIIYVSDQTMSQLFPPWNISTSTLRSLDNKLKNMLARYTRPGSAHWSWIPRGQVSPWVAISLGRLLGHMAADHKNSTCSAFVNRNRWTEVAENSTQVAEVTE